MVATRKTFFQNLENTDGMANFIILGVTPDIIMNALNELDMDFRIGEGRISRNGKSIHFMAGLSPDTIHDITKKLQCTGLAYTDTDSNPIESKDGKRARDSEDTYSYAGYAAYEYWKYEKAIMDYKKTS